VPKLFHLRCSPRPDSESAAGAEAFLARFREARPSWEIDVMDVWRERLPEFDATAAEAKLAVQTGQPLTAPQRDAWAVIERMAVRFALAERVLISTPMWNFGVPYKLKHWIDLVNQPGLTFRFDPAIGYVPLIRDRPTVVILACGSDFVTGMNRGRADMASPYLREALRFMGVRDARFVLIGPTTGPRGPIEAARERARARLVDMASSF